MLLIVQTFLNLLFCCLFSASCKSGWRIWSPNICWSVGNSWDLTARKGNVCTRKCWVFDIWCTTPNGGEWSHYPSFAPVSPLPMCVFLQSILSLFLNIFSFLQTQVVSDETWKLIDSIWEKRVQEIRSEASMEIEEDKSKPELLMASHFM